MLKIDILEDEQLSDILDSLISAMLPHENYDPGPFGGILMEVFKYIKHSEMTMEYYVMFSLLTQLKQMKSVAKNFEPYLTRENLEITLSQTLLKAVQEDKMGLKEWNTLNNHSNDLFNQLVLEQSVQRLYSRIMDLYDRAFEKAYPSKNAMTLIPAFKDAIIANVAESSIKAQAMLLDSGIKLGKKHYYGASSWKEFLYDTAVELRTRFDSDESKVFRLDSVDALNEIQEELGDLFDPLANYGIPPLDASAPILKHWLVIFCANEGVGKTAFAINVMMRLIINKEKVVFMCGETKKAGIFARAVSHYVYLTRGKFITTEQLANLEELDSDIQSTVKLAMLELVEAENEGLLNFVPAFSYKGLRDELRSLYEEIQFSGLFIDHSLALSGGKNPLEDVGHLAVTLREFKNDYPVYIGVCSHLSTVAKELISKGKRVDTGPTKGNSNLSGEADEVFIFFQDEKMKRQNLVATMVSKTRGQEQVLDLVMLKFLRAVSTYKYDPADQVGYDSETIEADKMLETLVAQNEDEEEEYGWQLV